MFASMLIYFGRDEVSSKQNNILMKQGTKNIISLGDNETCWYKIMHFLKTMTYLSVGSLILIRTLSVRIS